MARPSKPVVVLRTEKKTHRTKRELASREREEKALLTGMPLKASAEVKEDPAAFAEFKAVKKLLASIGKDDALYGNQINRYCLLTSECKALRARARRYEALAAVADADVAISYYKMIGDAERELMAKRKMMSDIEKENCMTIAAALRSIPKKQDKQKNPLMEALSG